MTTVEGFFHVGVTVASLERSLHFYRDCLGLEVQSSRVLAREEYRALLGLAFEEVAVAFLDLPGGGYAELMEYRGLERLSAAARPCDYGSGHFALFVSDIEEAVRSGIRGGGALRGEIAELVVGPFTGSRVCYLLDPDGYPIELLQRPADTPRTAHFETEEHPAP